MTHFFEKRDQWGNGMALWVLLGMLFLAPPALWSVQRIKLQNDVENWLPSDDPQAKALHWFESHFPQNDRVLLSWDGSSLDDPRIERLKTKLMGTDDKSGRRRHGSKYVELVVSPRDVIERMTAHRVEPQQAIDRLQGVLIGQGPLRAQLSPAGRSRKRQTIETLVTRGRSELGIDLTVVDAGNVDEFWESDAEYDDDYDDDEDVEDEDEDGEDEESGMQTADTDEEPDLLVNLPDHDLRVTWQAMHLHSSQIEDVKRLMDDMRSLPADGSPNGEPLVAKTFFVSGSPIALSVSLSRAGSADTREAFRAIRKAATEIGIPENELRLGGRPIAGSELNLEVKKSAWNRDFPLSNLHRRSVLLFSAIASVVLAFLMLRSFRLATLVLVVTVYTTLLAVAVIPLSGGSMNMVVVVMPPLLTVLTVSAAIHVVNYWRHSARHNTDTAVVEATKMARQPCTLAAMTTAIGLASLTTSPLAPVRDFGLYSAIGCLISLVVVLYILPALLQFWPPSTRRVKPARQPDVDETGWNIFAGFLCKNHTLVTVASMLTLGVCLWGLHWFKTETKVIRYFPDDSRVVADYNFLEENLAGIIPVETIVRFDTEAQEELNFLQRMELVREVENNIRAHPEISGALSLADFQPVSSTPPPEARFPRKAAYHKKARIMEDRIKTGTSRGAGAFFVVADHSGDLQTTGDALLNKPGDELWRITAQVAIMSDLDYDDLTRDLDEIARSTLKYHAGAGHVVTGLIPLFLRTQQAVLDSLITSFCLAFAVIAVVMAVLLRNPISGMISMLPNILPVGIVFGLISWKSMAVDIGTMITASVALGIAVDGTLHLLTWFRIGIENGRTRHEAIARAMAHCGPAMCQTSAAVGLGLLVLASADLLLIARFGWLMASLIGTALVSDLIFLPALLAGPLGSLIEKTTLNQAANDPPTKPTPNEHLRPHLSVAPPSIEQIQLSNRSR